MQLIEYIKDIGPTKFAELVGVSTNQVHKYQNLADVPRPKLARKIVKLTHGLVTYEDIYEPFFANQELDPQLSFDLDQ
jgi:hypothetical protein